MQLVESRLEQTPSKRPWLCVLLHFGKGRHSFRTGRSAGWSGKEGYYCVEACAHCGLVEHVFLEEGKLTEDEMRERAEKETRTFAAIAWMLDNVEPDYAAGRGTENGKIVDRDEPWAVPLEDRQAPQD